MRRQLQEPDGPSPAIPSKGERQAAFLVRCRAERLSNEQIVRRASFVPFGKRIKVLHWPNL
jgi:hypothetical protein